MRTMSTPSPETPASTPTRNARLSADDWAQAALDLIAEQGVSAVAVEPLARRLGVTKGSFYWHFPSRDALLQAALERWEVGEQENIFGSLEKVADPRERLRALFQLVGHEVKPHIIYSELLKALDHPAVQPVIDRISQRRLDYLVAMFRQAGLQRTDATHRARLAYAAYVGFLQLSLQLQQPRMTSEEFETYLEHVISTLIPT
ncbi:MAG: TetR/AcrR family transcriptional regulator [Xanthomonadaceae bacterium]|jgi:AcrR family transcriptional regulator|uniref:TetR family transcriptional regulator n=2 Tax=Lysobacteraceae TaxID=32033 RepID=A0ABQ6ZD27_9GAMM|nr:TetR family transcriptional regulator [Pseudoxanthomonas japonensis]NCT71815.1 TetR/AcrR family transcriptional regulator [Xanthomonadaceae bacterium]